MATDSSSAAKIAAQARYDELKKYFDQSNFLSDIDNLYNAQKEAAESAAKTTLDTLTESANRYKNQFGIDARSANINREQNKLKLENELNRLGLSNTGYGVTQRLQTESDYGQNLTSLQNTLSQNLADIDLKKAEAQSNLGTTLADLLSNYTTKKTAMQQYINEQLQNAYDREYEREYQAAEDAAARQLQLASLYSSNRYSSNGRGSYEPDYQQIETDYYKGDINPDVYYGSFGTQDKYGVKYQPNNIGGVPLSKTGKQVKDVFGSNRIDGASENVAGNQNIWKSNNGMYYVWDGTQNRYVDVTSAYRKKQSNYLKNNSHLNVLGGNF